jgi:pimeloyl-ACP methyl ester carboxylesterase
MFESARLDSAGVIIHYIVAGTGEPVILIHGFSLDVVSNWVQPGIFKELSDRYKVIAFDLRGHGESDKPHDASAYGAAIVDDVLRLMDHLEIAKAHLVGYSMGGEVALALLTEHPGRVLTVTIGAPGWINDPRVEKMRIDTANSLDRGMGIDCLIKEVWPLGWTPPTEEMIEAINRDFLTSNDPLAMAAAARGQVTDFQLSEEKIRANASPVLALTGELDPLKIYLDALKAIMPSLSIVVIPGATHMSAFSNSLFLSSVQSFLAENPLEETQATGNNLC